MTKSQINIRASALMARQLEELTSQLGTSITETISIAIDRMYQKELGNMNVTRESLTETFNLMFNDVPLTPEEEANAAEYDQLQAAKRDEVQAALSRFMIGTNSVADTLLLERSALVEAIYRSEKDDEIDSDQRPIGFRLRRVDGNEYTDQIGLEEKPGRL